MPPLRTYQPRNGIHISSFLVTKQLSGRKAKLPKMSNMHWCLAAISAAPLGRFSRPRTSTRMSQITRSRAVVPTPYQDRARVTQALGPSSSGSISRP